MQAPTKSINERSRIQNLKDLNILDTPITKYFERITRITKALFDVPIVAISLVDQERQWFKSIQGLDVCETSREVSFCGHAILQDDIFIINDALLDQRFADNPLVTHDPKIRFYAGYPIKSKYGNKIGTLCIIDNKPRNYTAKELGPLKDMAALVEDELLNQKRYELQTELLQDLDESERKNFTDPLTRVLNRAGIEAILLNQLVLYRSQQKGFSLALIDIDDFKHINDTYGHLAGDQVLIQASKLLIDSLRDNDAFGRWGGEEFLMIIDLAEKKQLIGLMERLRKKLQETPICYKEHQIIVTITAGILLVNPTKNQSIPELVNLVDSGLYEGKNSGKNKIVFIE